MRTSVKYALWCGSFVVLLMYAVQYAVDRGLRKSKMQYFATWNDIYSGKINADVIVNGSSRAFLHISPQILDTILHLNSYNLGLDGWGFPMQFARFRIYLQHNKKPRYIIQSIDLDNFEDRKDLYSYRQFLPYLNDREIRDITSRYEGKFTFPEMYFPLFKYNNNLNLVKEGLFCYFNIGKVATNKLYKGFGPRSFAWDSSFERFKAAYPNGTVKPVQENAVREFEQFLNYCRDNDIKVIFVFTPILREELAMEKNAGEIIAMIDGYSKKYNFLFLNYANDTLGADRKYFYNSQHLNAQGAALFTTKLASDLKPFVQAAP